MGILTVYLARLCLTREKYKCYIELAYQTLYTSRLSFLSCNNIGYSWESCQTTV